MNISYNGNHFDLLENTTIQLFMEKENPNYHSLVVEYNFKLIKKDDWSKISIKDGDTIRVLRFVGGG